MCVGAARWAAARGRGQRLPTARVCRPFRGGVSVGRLRAARCQPGGGGVCIPGGVRGQSLSAQSVRRRLFACSPVLSAASPCSSCRARRVVRWWGGRGLWGHRGQSTARGARACTPEGLVGDVDQRAAPSPRPIRPAAAAAVGWIGRLGSQAPGVWWVWERAGRHGHGGAGQGGVSGQACRAGRAL